jgi:hypothetical protein
MRLTQGYNEIVKMIMTFPSAQKLVQKAGQVFSESQQVQVKIDHSKGFWKGDERQLGIVGISDADKKFHPNVICIQKSEDGMGSAAVLGIVTEMLMRSGTVPHSRLKDDDQGSSHSPLVPIWYSSLTSTALRTFLDFRSNAEAGPHGSRGSMARYFLSVKDDNEETRRLTKRSSS